MQNLEERRYNCSCIIARFHSFVRVICHILQWEIKFVVCCLMAYGLSTGIRSHFTMTVKNSKKLTKLQRGPWLVGEPLPDWGFLRVVQAGMRYARGLCLCPLHAFLIYLKDALYILEEHCRVSQAMYPPPFGVIRYTCSLLSTCTLPHSEWLGTQCHVPYILPK